MAIFLFHALDQQQRSINDMIEADHKQAAYDQLVQRGLIILELTESKPKLSMQYFTFSGKFNFEQRLLFTNQLATLLSADIELSAALQIIAEQTKKTGYKKIILDIREQILQGKSLADSLANYQSSFGILYIKSIQAAEVSGHLPQVFLGLAEYLEKRQNINQKIKQAMLYPMIMMLTSLLVVVFLLSYVLPKIVPLFQQQHQTLPLATTVLLWGMHLLTHDWGWLLLFLLLLMVTIYYASNMVTVQNFYHRLLLQLPIIRSLLLIVDNARFTSTLAFLLNAGLPLINALGNANALIFSRLIKSSFIEASELVASGIPLYQALGKSPYTYGLTLHLIQSGEESGQLAILLEKAANHLESQLNHRLAILLALFEPLMILVMGGVVLFIVMAVLLPIFSLDQLATIKL